MDKSWIDLPSRACMQYIEGVENFLDFAFTNIISDTRIYCPCKKCCNRYLVEREVARAHIIVNGFLSKYKNWTKHGEPYVSLHSSEDNVNSDAFINDDMIGMITEAIGFPNISSSSGSDHSSRNEHGESPNNETTKFLKFLQDAESP